MRINISKKMMLMVLTPILFICMIVAVISTNVLRENITNEIEQQLKTGAYSISQTLTLRTLKEEQRKSESWQASLRILPMR